jgi:sensor histidine kinase YesM
MTEPSQPPPRAFTQGVGTVFQFVGVTMFLALFSTCCLSGLLSRESATHTDLTTIGWGNYSAQRAISISLIVGIVLSMAVAGLGLGMQAQRRESATMGVVVAAIGSLFWIVHTIFFATVMRSIVLTLIAFVFAVVFVILFVLAIGGWREMRASPPPAGFELLPAEYKTPHSHLHQDSQEMRLMRELEDRRRKLEVQQKELEMLEQKLRKKLKQKPGDNPR